MRIDSDTVQTGNPAPFNMRRLERLRLTPAERSEIIVNWPDKQKIIAGICNEIFHLLPSGEWEGDRGLVQHTDAQLRLGLRIGLALGEAVLKIFFLD